MGKRETLLEAWTKERRKGVSAAEIVARIHADSGGGDEPDDDGDDTDDEPKPVEKRKTKASKKKSKVKAAPKPADDDDTDDEEEKATGANSEHLVAQVERDKAKARALGMGRHVVAASDASTFQGLRVAGQNYNKSTDGFRLAVLFDTDSQDEAEAKVKLAQSIKAQAQAHPSTVQERNLDAQGIPWRSSPESVESLRDASRASARSPKPRELPAAMFRSFRSERDSGPFGGEGSAA